MEKSIQNNSVPSNVEKIGPKYEYTFKWKIEKVFDLLKVGKLCSPYFYPIPGREFYIELELFQRTKFFINLFSNDDIKLKIYSSTKFSDTTDEDNFENFFQEGTDVSLENSRNLIPHFSNHLLRRFQFALNRKFILTCYLRFNPIINPTDEICHIQPKDKTKIIEQFVNDMKKLHDEEIHWDVILCIDGVSIKAHKGFLCSRSPVFTKMFEHELQEKGNDTVHIEDVDATAMKQFISLLYCPVINETCDFEFACNLYYVADKYEVLNLRSYIGKVLLNKISERESYFFRLLDLAILHKDDFLKMKVLKLISLRLETLINSELWEDFVIKNGSIASSLMRDYFKTN